MSPEDRVAEILDFTAELVSSQGVASLSVEKIGKAAGISKSLVYSYFPSITELLQALHHREMKSLRAKQFQAAERANTLEQLVRGITHEYLTYIEERGMLIYRLQSEPSVAIAGGPTDYSLDTSVKYLADMLAKLFDLPPEVAEPAVEISFGLPDAAGRYLDEKKCDKQTIEDITVAMIIGSITAIKDDFDVKFKPLR